MRASTALACLVGVGAMSAGCTLLNSGDELLRDSGVQADGSTPFDAMCLAGSESDDSQCKDGCDNNGNGFTDCDDPSCSSAPVCRPACTVPSDCGPSGWCVANVCEPTITFTVSVLDGQTVVPAGITTTDTADNIIDNQATNSITGSVVVQAIPGGTLAVFTAERALVFASLPAELDGQIFTLSTSTMTPSTTAYDARSDIAPDVSLSTGCENDVIVPSGMLATVRAGGHCSSSVGPVVLGCDSSTPTECGLQALFADRENVVTGGPLGRYGLMYTGVAPDVSTLSFRVGNSSLRTWDGGGGMSPSWTLPDITGTGVVAHLEASNDRQRVVFATMLPRSFSVTAFPEPLVTTSESPTTWTTPRFEGNPPDYYALESTSGTIIVPGDTTFADGSFMQITAYWDSRNDLGNPYASAIRYAFNETLDDDSIVASAAAY